MFFLQQLFESLNIMRLEYLLKKLYISIKLIKLN